MDDYIKRDDAINSTWKALYAYEDRTEEQFQNDPDLDLGDWALHRIFVQGVHAEALKEIIGIPAADVAPVPAGGIGELSDGYHTFNGLYHQRMILTAALVKAHKDIAWKSWRHEDGWLCFGGGWFIVGFDTPEGGYTYHYEAEHWDLFDCEELPCGKHWDGHTEDDVGRLLTIPASTSQRHGHWLPCNSWSSTLTGFECSECGAQFQNIRPDNYCGYCGAKMEADNG